MSPPGSSDEQAEAPHPRAKATKGSPKYARIRPVPIVRYDTGIDFEVKLDAFGAAWFSSTMVAVGRDKTTLVLIGIAIGVWVVAGFLAFRASTEPIEEPTTPSAIATTDPAAPASHGAADPAAPSAQATSAGGAGPRAPQKKAAKDPSRCIADTLGTEGVEYAFVCDQDNPMKASGLIKSALVRHGKGLVTDAMRQWAGLGWYEMAAFAALRAHCCATGDALAYNFTLACPLDEAINELDAAVRTADREKVDEALAHYTKEARCLDQFGQSRNMGRDGPPGAGIAAMRRLLDTIVREPP